jgi:ribosomal protein S18 acetylase RimI-like enzyme
MAVRTRPAGGRSLPGWVRTRDHAAPDTVHFTVVDPRAVTVDTARQCCEVLAQSGYRRLVTNALAPRDTHVLVAAGFVVCEELDLFGRPLDELPPSTARTRRVRRLGRLADLDRRAFADQAFDVAALHDARTATPAARVRVTGARKAPTGYAITGAAGTRGYVQRLAVDPGAQRQGLGRALLLDGLHWARRRGARHAMVNTNRDNAAARALYAENGFVALPEGLRVLERAL